MGSYEQWNIKINYNDTKIMIIDFENKILCELGIEPKCFDKEYMQWVYSFSSLAHEIVFTYSLDNSVSITIYIGNKQISFSFFSNLQYLEIIEDTIVATILNKNDKEVVIKIDTINITVNVEGVF